MHLTVNGFRRSVDAERSPTLLAALRDQLGLAGTKLGCDRGECGACTVRLDGQLVYSCLVLTAACDGGQVQTVEGLETAGKLNPLQQAFLENDAAQCGYCTPGQLLAAADLLEHNPHPTDDDIRTAMSGNLCRCGTYPRIVAAIRAAAGSTENTP